MISESQEYCLIIGTARGGTSTLFATLKGCSGIAGSTHKELHYFDQPSAFTIDLETYSRKFVGTGIRMEGTPSYLFVPLVPKRIKEIIPQARFIVLLRNPIDRAFSHYALVQRHRNVPNGIHRVLTFEEALALEETEMRKSYRGLLDYSYVSRGRYAEQLQNWFSYFSRDRFLIVKSEDYFAHTEQETAKCLSFALGKVPVNPKITLTDRFFNKSSHHTVQDYGSISKEVREKLQQHFQPYNEQLYTLLGKDFGWV